MYSIGAPLAAVYTPGSYDLLGQHSAASARMYRSRENECRRALNYYHGGSADITFSTCAMPDL